MREMPITLTKLPVEIIDHVIDGLESQDICSLRLTCRHLNENASHRHSLACFITVRTDLSLTSLQRLRNISNVARLAVCVRVCHIKYCRGDALGDGFNWYRNISGGLQFPLEAFDMLQGIINKFINCHAFQISTYEEFEPSYGTSTLIPSDAVGIAMALIGDCNIAVKSFTIFGTFNSTRSRLNSNRLPLSVGQRPDFNVAWSGIEELDLGFSIYREQHAWVLSLLSNAPKTRKLSLWFDKDSEFCTRQLSSATRCFFQLEELKLRTANVAVGDISTLLIQNGSSLRSIYFDSVKVINGDKWATIFQNIKDKLPHLISLCVFNLREEMLDWSYNRHVGFSGLMASPLVPRSDLATRHHIQYEYRLLEGMPQPVQLEYLGMKRLGGPWGVKYQGMGMSHLLCALADTAKVVQRALWTTWNLNIRPSSS